MNAMKVCGLVLIVLGALALAYGGFSYKRERTAVKLGTIELTVEEKKSFDVPKWAGIGAIVSGGLLLLIGGRRT